MALVALALGLCIAALGGLALVSPRRFVRVVQSFETAAGIYVAAAIRFIFGIALVLAAPGSRAPRVIWIAGVVIFVAGVLTLLVGRERYGRLLGWWLARRQGFRRVWGAVALVLGLSLAYALMP